MLVHLLLLLAHLLHFFHHLLHRHPPASAARAGLGVLELVHEIGQFVAKFVQPPKALARGQAGAILLALDHLSEAGLDALEGLGFLFVNAIGKLGNFGRKLIKGVGQAIEHLLDTLLLAGHIHVGLTLILGFLGSGHQFLLL